MRKTDKKLDNALREALTDVCEVALEQFEGFQWLTHLVNYNAFPSSLSIVCVFEENAHLAAFFDRKQDDAFCQLIKEGLFRLDIGIKDWRKHVSFDTEENCMIENNGKWHERFAH